MGKPFFSVVKSSLKSFFDIQESDSQKAGALKIGKTAVRRVIYTIADYWLTVLSAMFIIFMDVQMGYKAPALFLLMWALDIIVASAFVIIWQRTNEDVTLGESYRRAADAIHASYKMAGYLVFIGVVVKASFWDGPEHIVIFLHKEIRTELRMMLVLLCLTAIQAAIWAPIYVLGFEAFTELWSH